MCLRGPRQLTQFNIGKLIRGIDNPRLDNYIAAADVMDKVAERAEGYVWKYETQLGGDASIFLDDYPSIVIDLTLW